MGSKLLYSSQLLSASTPTGENDTGRDSNTYQQFRLVDERVVAGVKEIMSELGEDNSHGQ